MRYSPFLIVALIISVARPSAAQNKEEGATAKRIAEIQRDIRGLEKEMARIRAEMVEPDPAGKRKAAFEKETRELQIRMAILRAELRKIQPEAPIKTGVRVHCNLEVTPVRGRMIPRFAPYGEGATIRILTPKERKILAEGKTDSSSSVTLAVPPGKYLLEVNPRFASASGPPIEVTVEKDRVTALGVIITSSVIK